MLDLDETLVKSVQLPPAAQDYSFMIVTHEGIKRKYQLQYRPYLMEFLERIREIYHLVVYTSSNKLYAEKIVELIDPKKTLFKAVFASEYCFKGSSLLEESAMQGQKTFKDLRIFDDLTDPAKILMVDDRPEHFISRPENGVPILPYQGGLDDMELAKLCNYLSKLAAEPGLASSNASHFKQRQLVLAGTLQDALDTVMDSRPPRFRPSQPVT